MCTVLLQYESSLLVLFSSVVIGDHGLLSLTNLHQMPSPSRPRLWDSQKVTLCGPPFSYFKTIPTLQDCCADENDVSSKMLRRHLKTHHYALCVLSMYASNISVAYCIRIICIIIHNYLLEFYRRFCFLIQGLTLRPLCSFIFILYFTLELHSRKWHKKFELKYRPFHFFPQCQSSWW